MLGIGGVLLAFFYHAPPVKLSYRGLGEIAVATVYGPMICCGTFLVQRNEISTETIFLSIPLGILIAAFLVINEFPDRIADLSAHKMNLVVRLGVKKIHLAVLFSDRYRLSWHWIASSRRFDTECMARLDRSPPRT